MEATPSSSKDADWYLGKCFEYDLGSNSPTGPFSWPETLASKMKEGAKSGGNTKIKKHVTSC